MKRNFNNWLSTFKESIADWKYYTDFDKVYKNVDILKFELNLLNSLIGSTNIEEDFRVLVAKYPEVLRVIPILLAKREYEIKITDADGYRIYNFMNANYSIEEYVLFMNNTGLFDLISRHIIRDLTDYVKGVEVGLDSNARKNRTGKAMENFVENYLVKLGFIKNKTYFSQMTAKEINRLFGVDLSNLNGEEKADKRFDFVVKTPDLVYAIEVNFYGGGGSKLNETARSYKMIASESQNIQGFRFIWITDGQGWYSARYNLEETFNTLEDLYNINDLECGIFAEKLK
ncbi:MAG: restriction endonuclease [Tenericutes bacterium GWC2_34_14]|jgi:type II restriction enzyme|nr:MAG: restriction endonuclease [Tenericutes bacterium GWC2_34_14]OHE33899.1 MAG: restriction endonuclease [Tenericutes bacterium GWE2_34_108]OHE36159.1 MAG: restriction endonuclease [Tenericutes bacterium GWF1_35_14]OHE37786.1 MAG: restriction endonuclease [Tenericutes bacterium GWF2_35_184]OHE44455.1 MAG: restriction endonuclease [Tenericutes bacterium RIFOXYA2_FULL_36_32]OHE47676.1 MAG: restriction endonuclease [Tenericutes bacterium RIFOXYB2_FULL_36_25]OHE50192.1 MAG: restriction endonuc